MKAFRTLLYYCYSHIQDGEQYTAAHLKFCKSLKLTGRIIIADEGINGTVSGTPEACQLYMDYVYADGRFNATEFKIDEVDKPSFIKIHCRYKTEIVYSGLKDHWTSAPVPVCTAAASLRRARRPKWRRIRIR